MSDLTTTAQNTVREACIQTLGAVQRVSHAVAKRAKDPTGQTAAEYMGILLLISAIIVAIFGLHLNTTISNAVNKAVNDIINSGGGSGTGGGGGTKPAAN
jgi:Flp pilus assembly pilin Flp